MGVNTLAATAAAGGEEIPDQGGKRNAQTGLECLMVILITEMLYVVDRMS